MGPLPIWTDKRIEIKNAQMQNNIGPNIGDRLNFVTGVCVQISTTQLFAVCFYLFTFGIDQQYFMNLTIVKY